MSEASPRPWSVLVEETSAGASIKIVDARGGVVCLMKSAGGRKQANADLIVQAVNQ
jgi:hypothetical protein